MGKLKRYAEMKKLHRYAQMKKLKQYAPMKTLKPGSKKLALGKMKGSIKPTNSSLGAQIWWDAHHNPYWGDHKNLLNHIYDFETGGWHNGTGGHTVGWHEGGTRWKPWNYMTDEEKQLYANMVGEAEKTGIRNYAANDPYPFYRGEAKYDPLRNDLSGRGGKDELK